jgi:hypothetical protein
MSGHVWLSDRDQARLAEEMALQGMTDFPVDRFARGDEMQVTITEIEAALMAASPDPVSLDDSRLWTDWLAFLRGAATNGGLLVR